MPPMKKPASPAPTPRAAALSQSASRFSAGATSAWQNIAGNSPRLAAAGPRQPGAVRGAAPLASPTAPGASRAALETQQVAEQVAPATAAETIRQVGWREVDRAVGMSTKRKYSVFGVGFGPKVPVFETEKVKLPVYQETDREKRYYAAVKAEDVARIKREGFQAEASSKSAAPKTIKQFNSDGHICFFNTEANARSYGQKDIEGNYAIVEFVMPEYHDFVLDSNNEMEETVFKSNKSKPMQMKPTILAECIKHVKEFHQATNTKYTE
jgi:hypothetical protein